MTEQVQESGAPVVTPLSELVDKPRLSDQPAAATPEPAITKEPAQSPPSPPAPADDDKRFRGLLNEALTEREKRQAVERERDESRKALADLQAKLQRDQDNDPAPDMFRDPDGYNAWLERTLERRAQSIAQKHVQPIMQQVSDQTLRLSELTAERALGPERWKALNDWIPKQGQQFMDWCMSQPDPYHAAWEQYRTRTTFERLGNDDIDTLIEKEVQKRLAEKAGPVDPPDDDDIDHTPARTPPNNAPRSFAASRSAQPRDQEGRWAGPKPLSEIDREKHQRKKR